MKPTSIKNVTIREYRNIHGWIQRHYGKAFSCEHCNTSVGTNFEWALKKGCLYECNIDNYIQLCKSCHVKYDRTTETNKKISESLRYRVRKKESYLKSSQTQKGRPVPIERRIKISNALKGRPSGAGKAVILYKDRTSISFPTISMASKTLGIGVTSMTNALNNRSRSCGGYKIQYLSSLEKRKY